VASREATRLRHRTTAAGAYVPMDCRACFDGEFLFLTMLDASEATRVEDSLRESLSTSAFPLLTCPCWLASVINSEA
jgi:hypothetical protein